MRYKLKNSLINTYQKKQTFKQLLTGCLFAIFLINTTLCFMFFEVSRIAIRHDIKHNILRQLTDNQLVRFLKNNNLDKDEFEFNGIMYDVVRQETINGQVILLCFEDKKETQLNDSIEASIKTDFSKNPFSKNQQKLIDFLHQTYISSSIPNFFFFAQNPNNQYFPQKSRLLSKMISIISPPPKF